MNEPTKVYWDACAWLGLINGEAEKLQALEYVWSKAEHGEVQIWTSAFCIAEVYRTKCEGERAELDPADDAKINNLFDQDFVEVVQLDLEIAKLAKSLLRTHDKLKKPSDAIHLATAITWNVEQLHTYDGSDLIGLTVNTLNGNPLPICKPDMIDGSNLLNYKSGEDA